MKNQEQVVADFGDGDMNLGKQESAHDPRLCQPSGSSTRAMETSNANDLRDPACESPRSRSPQGTAGVQTEMSSPGSMFDFNALELALEDDLKKGNESDGEGSCPI